MSLVSCASVPFAKSGPKLIDGKPEWYFNPSKDGKIGGVGVSGIHKDGKTGQKQLAVERALAEIARQMGVKVESYSSLQSQTAGGSSSVSGQSHSFFTVDGKSVNARIEQMWENKYSGELFIWMVAQ
ncbi:MAG: hypothetical protein C0603_02810 [Denitrovibrio sp.]|nr:MAG: hypothetical protein C0603_02810 [Denitrovibrio sp.]